VDTEEWDKAPAIEALKQRFGIGEELIEAYFHPYVYLNRDLIAAKGLEQAEVEEAVADELTTFEGVALAVSSSALREGRFPDTRITKTVLRNFNPSRSGDIFVVHTPQCFINDFDGLTVTCTHGSPWRYDTFVPVVFASLDLHPKRVIRAIETVDVAPTLSAMTGAKPPSGSRTGPLPEIFLP
jgi:hypothetical protein